MRAMKAQVYLVEMARNKKIIRLIKRLKLH
jgi:hypothetical protein